MFQLLLRGFGAGTRTAFEVDFKKVKQRSRAGNSPTRLLAQTPVNAARIFETVVRLYDKSVMYGAQERFHFSHKLAQVLKIAHLPIQKGQIEVRWHKRRIVFRNVKSLVDEAVIPHARTYEAQPFRSGQVAGNLHLFIEIIDY